MLTVPRQHLVFSVVAMLMLFQPGLSDPLSQYEDEEMAIAKNNECVLSTGSCFNSDQCCSGLICVDESDKDSSDETPGRCAKSKNLRACSSVEDCYVEPGYGSFQCLPHESDGSGQRYCFHAESKRLKGISTRSMGRFNGTPRKYQSYAKVLSNIAGSCQKNADCMPVAVNNPGLRLCCQQVSQGRQGTRRICDRITAVSICIP